MSLMSMNQKVLLIKLLELKIKKKINKFFYVLNSSLDQQHEAHSEINHGVISKSNRLTISPLVRKRTFTPLHSRTPPFYFSRLSAPLIH